MKNLKDKVTNICGILGVLSGAILAMGSQGVILPNWLRTYAIVSGCLAGAVTAYLIGKKPDGTAKTPEQLNNQ